MDIGKDHKIRIVAATVAKELNDMILEALRKGIPRDALGQVGDDDKFELGIVVTPIGKNASKLGLTFSKAVPILKSLLK